MRNESQRAAKASRDILLHPVPAAFHRRPLTLYRMVMPIGTPFLKEKINN